MDYIAEIIVRYRFLFMLLFVAAAIFCALSLGKTKINSDITSFLPDTTDTRRGLSIMNEEFIILANEEVMVANITYEKAEELAESIRGAQRAAPQNLLSILWPTCSMPWPVLWMA